MSKMKSLALLLTLVVSGCAVGRDQAPTPSLPPIQLVDDWCLNNRPIRPTEAEISAMTDETVERILTHNELGAKRCGWTPGK